MSERTRFWLVTLAALLALTVTTALGRWQLGRAEHKQRLQADIEERARLPVLDAAGLTAPGEVEPLLHRRLQARGHWLAERTVYLDNRQMNGRPGFFVVTPLRLDAGQGVLLVQRGWVPRNFEDRSRVPRVETPAGPVRVEGRVAETPSRLYELGAAETGPIRQNLDLARFRAETGLDLLAVTLLQTDAGADGLARDWPPIDSGVDKHHGYAFQWFGLSALIAVLYVWFQIVKRFIARRAR